MAKRKKKKQPVDATRYRVFVDYENSPDCLPLIERHEAEEIWIFVGRQQKKIPLETVQRMQRLGRGVHWVAPGVVGKNALDFILAMQVGAHHATADRALAFAIFSADRGFDPLIGELAKDGRTVIRVDPTKALPARKKKVKKKKVGAAERAGKPRRPAASLVDRVAERLRRMSAERRPSKKKTLLKHIESQLPAAEKAQVEAILESLERRRVLTIHGRTGAVTYR